MNGSKHGKGVYNFNDGQSHYEGYFKHDLFHGEGKLSIKSGEYKGSFQKGKMHGRGKFLWKDGSCYEGDYKGNKKHGMGKYLSP